MKRFSGIGPGETSRIPADAALDDLCELQETIDELNVTVRSLTAMLERLMEETNQSREELVNALDRNRDVGERLIATQDQQPS